MKELDAKNNPVEELEDSAMSQILNAVFHLHKKIDTITSDVDSMRRENAVGADTVEFQIALLKKHIRLD